MRKMHDKPARQRDVDALKPTCHSGGVAKGGMGEVSELRLESRVGSGVEREGEGRGSVSGCLSSRCISL